MGSDANGERQRLSPWQVLESLVATGKLVEVDGEYEVADVSWWQAASTTPSQREQERKERERENTRERVRAYRASLAANGDTTGGYRTHRPAIVERDGERCAYCGRTTGDLFVEHILAVGRGGRSVPLNLVLACRSCNKKKWRKTPDEAQMPLLPRAAAANWLRIKRAMQGRDRLEPEDWPALLADEGVRGVQGVYGVYQNGVHGVRPGVQGVQGEGVQGVQGAATEGGFPHHNGQNGAYNAGSTEGAYKEIEYIPPPPRQAAAEEALSDQASAVSETGGSGGVVADMVAVMRTIPGFVPRPSDTDEAGDLVRDFPDADLVNIVRDYAAADLKQPPSWRRLRKWIPHQTRIAASAQPARASPPAVPLAKPRHGRVLDFSKH